MLSSLEIKCFRVKEKGEPRIPRISLKLWNNSWLTVLMPLGYIASIGKKIRRYAFEFSKIPVRRLGLNKMFGEHFHLWTMMLGRI